jgi:DNA-binding GntR family transcriptional regulator
MGDLSSYEERRGIGRIHQELRDRIIWLDLAPEGALNISELAKAYEVSRTPIKEALIALKSEGWVLMDGASVMVTPLSLERFRELTEIRMALEVEANIWAMNRLTCEESQSLDKILKESQEFDSSVSNRQMAEADFRFHNVLYEATKNKQVARMLFRLLAHYTRFWLSIPRIIDPKYYYRDVHGFIQCIKEKNEPGLREVSQRHIQWGAEKITQYF